MSMQIVTSPILYATPFVGYLVKHNTQEGKLWLSCAEYGFSFCVAEIDDRLGEIKHGEVVRIVAALDAGLYDPSWATFRVEDACGISVLADRMLEKLFKSPLGTKQFKDAVFAHADCDEDERQECIYNETLPGHIFYKVVRI